MSMLRQPKGIRRKPLDDKHPPDRYAVLLYGVRIGVTERIHYAEGQDAHHSGFRAYSELPGIWPEKFEENASGNHTRAVHWLIALWEQQPGEAAERTGAEETTKIASAPEVLDLEAESSAALK
jgi:hypothetical protein